MSDLKPFEIKKFGGLNTVDDPLEFGWSQATAAANVMPTRGVLELRSGTIDFADLSCDSFQGPVAFAPTGVFAAFCKTSSTKTCTLKSISTTGTVTSASGAWTGASEAPTVTGTATFGVSGSAAVEVASYDGATPLQLKYWTGSGSVTDHPTSMKPRYVAVTPNSNRLAVANFTTATHSPTGANGSTSTVFFSDPNTTTTWGANNWVTLSPGDGEQITGMAVYRDFLFVFKESKFFVFYGESTGPDGSTPEFNYRTVRVPVGKIQDGGSLGMDRVAAGPDGVYFIAGNRLYVTDGGPPRWATEQLWVAEGPLANGHVTSSEEFVFWEPDSTANAVYVHHTEEGWWTMWKTIRAPVDIGGVYVHAMTAAGGGDLDFLAKRSTASVVDYLTYGGVGVAIDWSYTTGRQQFSAAGTECVVDEILFDGVSTFNAAVYNDGGDAATDASLVATAGTLGRFRKACRGRSLQLTIEKPGGTGASLSLNRIVANVRPGRPVGAS